MSAEPPVCAIVLAGGRSERFGADKLWQELDGAPLWTASLRRFLQMPQVSAVGVVCGPGREPEYRPWARDAAFLVPGGDSRQESALRGLLAVPEAFEYVLVHDAARPNVSEALVERVVQALADADCAFPGVPVTDTLRLVETDGFSAVDRSRVLAVQTPQGVRRSKALAAYAATDFATMTDDAAVFQAAGGKVVAVEGDPANLKVTLSGDLDRLAGPFETRTGMGYDVHAFSQDPDRPLWLGGVEFDSRPGLEGHSDADALLHAVVDALLGAAALGDIGQHFPNTDMRWHNAPSRTFLAHAAKLLQEQGWRINHVDATVVAERPKVMARAQEIRLAIADGLGTTVDRVSVKATTNEGLGSIGRGEGIACFATATIARRVRN
ncbi:MAG: 2-C-methyl-D-erythritol 2,4-cyclodiphosphate synthase [Fimbriimonadaceae bacterium]|nr:2-C-methyl-D-erythritol 2,4-cyclodiphosphate synthase [Fimbriimonadaceae bacterium]QYK56937.1 MAG: 2-C-methyl-D-erythritol 2,4-cyclodiphosphate synthase [Fimbriimonadaceae bacterium]